MKRKQLQPPELTYAVSAEDFARRFESQLIEVTTNMRCCDKETYKSILKELCAKRLVISLPSICYGIPFPFVMLNSRRVSDDKICPDWNIPRRDSFIHAAQAIYVGFRLDSMDELQDRQMHVCIRDVEEEPVIVLCDTSAVECIEVLKQYWKPSDSIDMFLQQMKSVHEIVTRLVNPVIAQ